MKDNCIQSIYSPHKVTRNIQFDFTRAICVLWIVCFWHVLYYLPDHYQLSESSVDHYRNITNAVLATFTFLSGFFLQKYTFYRKSDVLNFYKKRLLRFYPLYAVSIITWGVMSHCSIRMIIESLLGYSMFTTPMPTLWYFTMLITFYLFTPCLKYDKAYGIIKNYLIGGGIICLSIIALNHADIRYLTFLPFYIIGINVPQRYVFDRLADRTICFVVFAASVVMFILTMNVYSSIQFTLIADYSVCFTGCLVIVTMSYLLCPLRFARIIQYIAFSSMCAYLFHRQIYGLILVIVRLVLKESSIPLVLAIVSMMIIFTLAHAVQNFYNRIIKQ